MTTFKAHFDGKTIIPDEPVSLPVNQPLTLDVNPTSGSTPASAQNRQAELLQFLEEIERMAIECDAPEADFSRDSIYSGTLDDPR